MAIVWVTETARGRSLSVDKKGGRGSRSFKVRVDAPNTAIGEIRDAPGILVGDPHPDDGNLIVKTITANSGDESGLLYDVTVDYEPDENADQPDDPGDNPDKDKGAVPPDYRPYWGGSSSVSTRPAYRDINGEVMTNSAGDPLEGLEAEAAEFSLTKVEYFTTHAGPNGWLAKAVEFTNAVNDAPWNGDDTFGRWKCQGCSAKLIVDRETVDGLVVVRKIWEVTWEFKYKADYWRLEPWDIGFNELVNEEGEPQETPGISSGASY